MADVTQIHLPTRATQLEILDKVEYASFMVDVNRDTYLPVMRKELGIGPFQTDATGANVAIVDDKHLYMFNSSNIYKYDKQTLELLEQKYIASGLVTNMGNRTFDSDDTHIYCVRNEGGLLRIVKIDKATLTSTSGTTGETSIYGAPNRLVVTDSNILVNVTNMGARILDKTTMAYVGSKLLNPSNNPSVDIAYGGSKNPYVYMLTRLTGTDAMYIIAWNFDGSIKKAYQSPTVRINTNNGYIVPMFDNPDSLIFYTGNAVFVVDCVTLVPIQITSSIAVYNAGGIVLYFGNDKLFTYTTNSATNSDNPSAKVNITNIKLNKLIDSYGLEQGMLLYTGNYFDGVLYTTTRVDIGGYKSNMLTTMEEVSQIRHYRKVESI